MHPVRPYSHISQKTHKRLALFISVSSHTCQAVHTLEKEKSKRLLQHLIGPYTGKIKMTHP